MHSSIRPNQFVVIQLPSDQTRIVKLVPNTIVQLGKYGSFAANQILGRPFFFTFEILDAPQSDGYQLRVVPAEELHAENLIEEAEADGEGEEGESGASTPMRTNRNIVDDASTQKLTTQEIEELKKEASGAGKDIVAKLLESHTNLDKKTAFSLAKYTLRKRKKYIRRFTVLPLDVGFLTNFLLDQRDAQRTMELRDEHVGLLGCLGNVHHGGNSTLDAIPTIKPNGRYFVVDETGGLVVAAMAERMGILYPEDDEEEDLNEDSSAMAQDGTETTEKKTTSTPRRKRPRPMSASGNTITVIHAYSQPNLSLLKYFGYDINTPDESHPLHTHLKTMSWLQLVDPSTDPILSNEPPALSAEELSGLKASKRTAYYFKRNRWEKFRAVTDEARAGGFDGLIAATLLEPAGVLKHTIPLLSGSAAVAIYSPTIEPLTELMDLYSTARRTAFINRKRDLEMQKTSDGETVDFAPLSEEFPLDPTRLLPPTLHTTRVRAWQVLPGRTHPLMTGRGGAEGYLFHGVHVIPASANIQAAGTFRKKRKVETTSTPASDRDVEMTS
ncbi:tRNA (adenine(58)-N(1))-methyltransferase non-catalytic subunit trm6 [Penicillium cataractarum]|uniref:tRNA (adenine(58)-N(1))-methyltransferase non-catalytic subunit TRM6 n=1 Tax=Penicillium cataractarum TaxID=2100454 RepID=A0A9W9SNZ8_9EURO|nr:tRNA (adenine(58)-N(1))-methyltransferase non-catalytic subunit trm6 [Penicillium cataractarum]KAJ5382023.1 tRNA (adenine(58)-N(1))-methyltransferase non-catalytic subunit trm6 [Penicillium cataractarum]